MGADAEVYLFDTAVYLEQVVPFIRNLIRHGNIELAFDERMDRIRPHVETVRSQLTQMLDENGTELKPTDLDTHCTYLGHDFRLLPEHNHIPRAIAGEWADWDQRACSLLDCPARTTCPFHILDGPIRQIEMVEMLFEAFVHETCLGQSQFVGRSRNVFHYQDVLKKNRVSLDGELWQLLLSLGTRGFVIGYGFSNSDGIHGWLMPDETKKLASLLSELALPQLEPTFVAMEATRRTKPGPYELPGWEPYELTLAFVRTVATIAAEQGKGILWGNDVSSWLYE